MHCRHLLLPRCQEWIGLFEMRTSGIAALTRVFGLVEANNCCATDVTAQAEPKLSSRELWIRPEPVGIIN